MVAMRRPIGLSAETPSVFIVELWPTLILVLLVGVVNLTFGCAEVENPAVSPATIEVPTPDPDPLNPTLKPVSPPYSLAILPFEDYSNQQDLSWLRQGLPDMLVTDLALLRGVKIVSRHRLGEVLREQWLQHRGSFEEASSVRLGRMVGARYLLSGLYYVGGEDLILEVHLLDVEQGSVVRTFRVTGSPHAIPDLELDLASKFGKLFDPEALGQPEVASSEAVNNEKTPAIQFDPDEMADIQKEVVVSGPEDHAPLATTLRTDTALGLERLRHVRDAASRIADGLWAQSLAVRLGNIQYGTEAGSEGVKTAVTVSVPLSAAIREEGLGLIDPGLKVVKPDSDSEDLEIILGYEESDAGAQQLFREALQAPRRLFVRAIRESGEVLAVSSEWSWRMDLHVRLRSDGTVSVPRSSSPFLKGSARFGGTLLAGRDAAISFDTLVVPVSDESRTISVEKVHGESNTEGPQSTDRELEASVKTWLLHRWSPPVAESVPTSGYLPGNRRRGLAILSGTGGTVHHSQVIHIDSEARFDRSIRQLLTSVLGKCFSQCEKTASPQASIPQPFELRVQFELIKDIRHAGLSRKL